MLYRLPLFTLVVLQSLRGGSPDTENDAAAIMAKMAGNMDQAAEARRQYVYSQVVQGSMIRGGGQISRRENREYSVIPQPTGTEKKLVFLKGEYRKGKQLLSYSEPGFKYKDEDIDGELLGDLMDDLTDDKNSRDGISESLFPLRTRELASYRFAMKGQTSYQGRLTYQITFEPVAPLGSDLCVHLGSEGSDPCPQRPWRGEAWIDAEDLQPARIDTNLAGKVPWVIRSVFGTNIRQLGFSVRYVRVAPGVWFPLTYGTEFRLDLLWFYKRTVTLSLESKGFEKTEASSTIQYDLANEADRR